ncbi:SRPBCC domain-containing protein [Mucilaginibacter conchicola]|uniref:SRPBCC domain-containing protein n=1 Tax=Mucilaginibacter conchicola TaxID=2303333 RepID=A0A372NP81_9SPHI|nr:SRPBCC domain-containing protein [Mucilaginibacter conchicola]RFZ90165.1 SRPBCC domain-containing protein [Mucilaginibacter conchicola]
METTKFEIDINATPAKVWDSLWSDENYPKWTAAFCEGSHAITDWQEGSEVLFLDKDKNGMRAMIEKNDPEKFMSIKTLGEMSKGEEKTGGSPSTCGDWYENYTLTPKGNGTHLLIELKADEVPPEFRDFMDTTWPKALDELKRIAECPPAP